MTGGPAASGLAESTFPRDDAPKLGALVANTWAVRTCVWPNVADGIVGAPAVSGIAAMTPAWPKTATSSTGGLSVSESAERTWFCPIAGCPIVGAEPARLFAASTLPRADTPIVGGVAETRLLAVSAFVTLGCPSVGAGFVIELARRLWTTPSAGVPNVGVPAAIEFAMQLATRTIAGWPIVGVPALTGNGMKLETAPAVGRPSVGAPATRLTATQFATRTITGWPSVGAESVKLIAT